MVAGGLTAVCTAGGVGAAGLDVAVLPVHGVVLTSAPGTARGRPSTQLVADAQAAAHQPLVAHGALRFQGAALQLAVAAHHVGERLAGAVACHGLLRHQQGLLLHAFLQHGAHIHAGQQDGVRVGNTARSVTEPVFWSTVTSENSSLPASG